MLPHYTQCSCVHVTCVLFLQCRLVLRMMFNCVKSAAHRQRLGPPLGTHRSSSTLRRKAVVWTGWEEGQERSSFIGRRMDVFRYRRKHRHLRRERGNRMVKRKRVKVCMCVCVCVCVHACMRACVCACGFQYLPLPLPFSLEPIVSSATGENLSQEVSPKKVCAVYHNSWHELLHINIMMEFTSLLHLSCPTVGVETDFCERENAEMGG